MKVTCTIFELYLAHASVGPDEIESRTPYIPYRIERAFVVSV
jgi:hypothetical protein